jgi:hypothetical protein
MILKDVITEVRRITQDENTPYRYSDEVLLGYANQSLKRIAVLRPDLFAIEALILCATGSVIQSAPSDSFRLIEIYSVFGGDGVLETTREVLDQAMPTWMNDTAAPATNWMRHVRNPNKFFIYPKAPAGQYLKGEYTQTPPNYTSTFTVGLLSDVYFPVVVDATVFIVESIDNEHVNSNRAKLFQDSFVQALGVSVASKTVTDDERPIQPGGTE